MNDVDLMALTGRQMVNVCYSAMVDDVVTVGVSRYEAREAVDKEIANSVMMSEGRREALRRQRQGPQAKPQPLPESLVAQPLQLSPDLIFTAGLRPPTPPAGGGS